MPLYYLSIAYNGETWYEKYFRAVQEDTTKQNAYRVRVNKMLNDITEKPREYIDFLKINKYGEMIGNVYREKLKYLDNEIPKEFDKLIETIDSDEFDKNYKNF
jgi:hypothetical protein